MTGLPELGDGVADRVGLAEARLSEQDEARLLDELAQLRGFCDTPKIDDLSGKNPSSMFSPGAVQNRGHE